MLRRLPLLLAIAMLALFAGCGGGEESTADEPASSGGGNAGEIVQVRMKDILFEPENVTAKVGQTVRWTNDDAVDHNVKAQSGADIASDLIGKGETFDFKVSEPGKIPYVCTIHAGQKGSITVEG